MNRRWGLLGLLALPLAAFFGFVGWNKAVAAMPDLVRHGAWTVWLPEGLGRAIGWSELACALVLLGGFMLRRAGWMRVAAAILVVNQFAAAAVHLAHGEARALPQNAVLVAMLLVVAIFGKHDNDRETVR